MFLQVLNGGIWPCMRCSCTCLWDGDYVSQLPYVWYYVVVKSSVLVAWCLVCQDPVSCFCFVYCPLNLTCGECFSVSNLLHIMDPNGAGFHTEPWIIATDS